MDELPTDPLSNAARSILRLRAQDAYQALVPKTGCHPEAEQILSALSPSDLFSVPIVNPESAACVQAALWLWHDDLNESHKISQVIETPTGSFWHAIIHRREGDFGNSQYWYAKCRNHPILATISAHAKDIIANTPMDKSLIRLTMGQWQGKTFVDFVESTYQTPTHPRHAIAVALQQLEWRLLFDHCTRTAIGKQG